MTRRIQGAYAQVELWHTGGWEHDPQTDSYSHPNGHVIKPSDEQPGSYQLWAPTVTWKGPPGLAKDRRPSPDLQSHMDWAEKTGAVDLRHPDHAWQERLFGCAHTHGGRVLPQYRTAAAFDDPAGWKNSQAVAPSPLATQGASAYHSLTGIPEPAPIDFSKPLRTQQSVATVGRHYDSLPTYSPDAVPHFAAMQKEVGDQYHHMTHNLGLNVQTVDQDPYKDVHEMMDDVHNNKRLQVLGTHVTGGHPFFDDATNDKFRAVHDFYGHAGTGRGFDRHGEEAAYIKHAGMFTPTARPALAAETRGQNSSLILNGGFGPQKIATMDPRMMTAMGARGPLPEGLEFRHDGLDPYGSQNTSVHHQGKPVGGLSWTPSDNPKYPGTIDYTSVHPDYRRTGVGSALLDWTRQNVDSNITHSTDLTPSGYGFAKADGFAPTTPRGEKLKVKPTKPVREDSYEWPDAADGNGHRWDEDWGRRWDPKKLRNRPEKDKFAHQGARMPRHIASAADHTAIWHTAMEMGVYGYPFGRESEPRSPEDQAQFDHASDQQGALNQKLKDEGRYPCGWCGKPGHDWTAHPEAHRSARTASPAPDGHFDDQWKHDTMKEIADTGGFTMKDRAGDGPKPGTGTMVSLPEGEEHIQTPTGDNQADFVNRKWDQVHSDPDLYAGGWQQDDKNHYNDVSRRHDDPWEAGQAAMSGNQLGVYDLDGYYDPHGKPSAVDTPPFVHDQIAKGGARWYTS